MIRDACHRRDPHQPESRESMGVSLSALVLWWCMSGYFPLPLGIWTHDEHDTQPTLTDRILQKTPSEGIYPFLVRDYTLFYLGLGSAPYHLFVGNHLAIISRVFPTSGYLVRFQFATLVYDLACVFLCAFSDTLREKVPMDHDYSPHHCWAYRGED